MHQGVGDVTDAAETRDFERQFGGRNINTHAANENRHQFLFAESQAEIVNALHVDPW